MGEKWLKSYTFICECGHETKQQMWSDDIQPPFCDVCGNVMVEHKEVKINTFAIISDDFGRKG